MELKLLPDFIHLPLKALTDSFNRVRNTPVTIITGIIFSFFLILVSQIDVWNQLAISALIGVITAPALLSVLIWQLIVGSTKDSYVTDFITGFKNNYVNLLIGYFISYIALLIYTVIFIVLVSQFFGFDGSQPAISIAENTQRYLSLFHLFFLFITLTLLTVTFQFFDVIMITESVSPFEAFHKSYTLFRSQKLNVFMYTAVRGMIVFLFLISPATLLVIGFGTVTFFILSLIVSFVVFSLTIVVTVSYHIDYYNKRTEKMIYEYPYKDMENKIKDKIKNIR